MRASSVSFTRMSNAPDLPEPVFSTTMANVTRSPASRFCTLLVSGSVCSNVSRSVPITVEDNAHVIASTRGQDPASVSGALKGTSTGDGVDGSYATTVGANEAAASLLTATTPF